MRIPGVKKLRLAGAWLKSRARSHALVLGYHRIVNVENDPFRMSVSPQHFEQHLQVIKRLALPMRMNQLVEGLTEGMIPARGIALTFDDGYSDILGSALPLLQNYQIPATVFVVSGMLGQAFWWDKLVFYLNYASERPVFRENGDGLQVHWQVLEEPATSLRLIETVLEIYREVLRLQPAASAKFLDDLKSRSDFQNDAALPRVLSVEELQQLAKSGLVEVGSHSISHPLLNRMIPPDQNTEIQASKLALEKILGQEVHGFSFPNGAHFPAADVTLRQSGYRYACTSRNDVLVDAHQIYSIPRFWIPDWDGARFERWLRTWL